MAMRIKAREKNLLLTCRSANKVEQVKTLKDGLRDTSKRKNYSKYQIDETERLDVYTRKRSKNIRKSHSENHMQIPIKESTMIKESTKVGPVSINDSNEDYCKNAHNAKRQTQNYSIKYTADDFKRPPHSNEDYERAIRLRESNQLSDGPDKKGDSTNKVIFVSLNSVDKFDKYTKRRKFTNQIKLRRLWKNLQNISSHYKKQKIGRLRKYCCQKPTSIIRKCLEKNESNRNDLKNEKISLRQNKTKETARMYWKESQDKTTESAFDSESLISDNSKIENNANVETSNQVTDELGQDSTGFLDQKCPHFFKKPTPEDDVSKIDQKYLKYILLITNTEKTKMLKNNENQENINKSEDRVSEILSKYKKGVNVIKIKTLQNELRSKRIPSITLKDNNQSKEHIIQNEKNLADHKIESESKPPRGSIISHQPAKQRKKIIVLKVSSPKQSDHNGKSRIDNKKESGAANTKQGKNNSKNKPNCTNPTPKKKELVTTLPREEVSKSEFIEIWRRNSRIESQDSLSTHSSTDPLDSQEGSGEDSSDSENLGIRSYQALKKVVEQEVLKIFKSYKQKEDDQNERKKTEAETTEKNTKAPVPLKKISETNTVTKAQLENKVQSADKQLMVVKDDRSDVISDRKMLRKINWPPQKEKLQKTRLSPQNQNFKKQDNDCEKLRIIIRNSSEELNKKLKILSEQENKDFKIPSEILKNWTIMHRLEKAFIALGTPDFHSKSLPPLTKTRVIDGKVTKAHNEKAGDAKTKTRTCGASVRDENKTSKPSVNSSKNKIAQKKLETKYLGKLEPEQKVKRKTEKETIKENKKNGSYVHDLVHSRKITQAPSIKKFPESSKTKKKREEISLSKDYKTKIKNRFKPDSLSRVPSRVFENNNTKRDHKIEKPIQTQEVSAKSNCTFVQPEPTYIDDTDADNDFLDSKVGFFVDPPVSLILECNHVNEIDFTEEAKHFDSQIEKLLHLKSSKKQLFERHYQNEIEDENLERKQTFAVFPVTETTSLKSKKSQSCHELEVNYKTSNVKGTCSTTNQKFNYWDQFEQNNKKSTNKQYSGSKTEKIQQISNYHLFKDDDYASDKISICSDEDVILSNPSEFSEQPNKGKIPVENFSDKLLLSQKEVNTNERVVKKRSILSLDRNLKKTQEIPSSETINKSPSIRYHKKPPNKATPDVFLQRIFHTKDPQSNYSNMSATSTATYDVEVDSNTGCQYPGNQTPKQIIVLSDPHPAPQTENISSTTFKLMRLSQELLSPQTKTVKIQPNWERDIQQYRAIVKDIIDQYKRTKGFLKQNEALLDSLTDTKFIEFQGETPTSSNFPYLDINEYRRKIISEYRDLSIFEYKSKIQETTNPNEKKTERSLAVVKEVTPEMDYDVKDFQPNVKKVLNSQIYVDQNHFYKLKYLREKPADQNPSLQEIMLGTSKLETQQIKLNEQSKSASIPKSNVSLPNSKVYSVLFHPPNHSKVEVDNDFTFEDFMSFSEFEETESDFTDYH